MSVKGISNTDQAAQLRQQLVEQYEAEGSEDGVDISDDEQLQLDAYDQLLDLFNADGVLSDGELMQLELHTKIASGGDEFSPGFDAENEEILGDTAALMEMFEKLAETLGFSFDAIRKAAADNDVDAFAKGFEELNGLIEEGGKGLLLQNATQDIKTFMDLMSNMSKLEHKIAMKFVNAIPS